ncbi:hypothetical protein A9179_07665 [Pseudomonas alcaligenes]|uniref:asparagine synthase (glutamine-hydrolyzing) n=1 Tax=Aquipseudomonas alcaligenes TaxID=43263 RepID=A0ABR7RY75_AQUAC|nr:asparagine synthase-related protein [Pseudomonas alcaligenes]MBC9250148.1 hypothetical protein [Pseudomonas alcaligenes]
MSAIAGIIRLDRQPVERSVLERMCNVLAPYGRDAQSIWQGGGAGLLRTLLRSTPEDAFDRQPLGDDHCMLVFSGRLDNREELAARLELPVSEVADMADAELVLLACRRWDTRALEYLLGSYALACWQPRCGRLWLARDPMGGRPLFWHQKSGFVAFASLPKALFCVPGIARVICQDSLLDRLAMLPMSGSGSFFKDVQRVEAGQVVLFEEGRLSSRFFHRFEPERELQLGRDEDYLEAFSGHFERAVAACLRSAGPVATHLSSGFDSSAVTALAARQLKLRGQRLTAFTAAPREGFAGPAPRGRHADESQVAAKMAGRFDNIDHVVIRSQGRSPLEDLQVCIEEMDRAPQNPCNRVWLRAIELEAQARGCRVMLTGERGNMSISYDGLPYLGTLFRSGRLPSWWKEIKACQVRRKRSLIAHSIAAALPAFAWRLIANRADLTGHLAEYSAVDPRHLAYLHGRSREVAWDMDYQPWHDSRAMRIAVLKRQDTAQQAMAACLRGVDMRDPTGDLRLVEFCLSVPDRQFLRNGKPRWLLQRMMAGVLPAEIMEARTKGYQASDWFEGLSADRERLRESLAQLKAHRRVGELLDLAGLEALMDEWPEEGWDSKSVVRNYRLKLLRGMAVGAFVRYVEPDNR